MGNATKFHPLTGTKIAPLGYRKDGRAIWPIMGASDPAPAGDPAPADPAGSSNDPAAPADPSDDGKGGKDAILADLAKERDKRQELQQQVQDLLPLKDQIAAIAKVFGAGADEPPDPAKLAEQITAAQGETATEAARADAAEQRLAVYMAASAPELGANPAALLDSTSFLNSLKDVDHTDEAKLSEVIKAAVEKNPALKAVSTPSPFPGGPRKLAGKPETGPGLPRLRDAYAQSSK